MWPCSPAFPESDVTMTLGCSNASRQWSLIALWAALAAGFALRIQRYAEMRGYWGDEAFLLVNILKLPPSQLFTGPLSAAGPSQVSPPAFTLALAALNHAFGPAEWAMRIVPLLTSLAALALFARLTWRLFPAPRYLAPAMTALFAICNPLIFQSANTKHYSLDVLASLAMLWAVLTPGLSQLRRHLCLALIGTLAAWLSLPALFVLVAATIALFSRSTRILPVNTPAKLPPESPPQNSLTPKLILALLPFASYAAMYLLSARNMQGQDLSRFWTKGFIPWTELRPLLIWLPRSLFAFVTFPFKPLGSLLLIPAIYACLMLRRTHLPLLIATTLPIALALIAAALHAYPFEASRATMYLLPGFFLLAAAGVPHLPNPKVLAPTLLTLTLAAGVYTLIREVIEPFGTLTITPAIAHLAAHRTPAEPILTAPSSGAIVYVYWHPRDTNNIDFKTFPTTAIPPPPFWLIGTYDRYDKMHPADLKFLARLGPPNPTKSLAAPGYYANYYDTPPTTQPTTP